MSGAALHIAHERSMVGGDRSASLSHFAWRAAGIGPACAVFKVRHGPNSAMEASMLLRSLRFLCLGSVLATTAFAASDPFAGTWKLNPAKSKLTDQMRVETATGPNTYTFYLSATNPETIVANGTDQPGIFGTT